MKGAESARQHAGSMCHCAAGRGQARRKEKALLATVPTVRATGPRAALGPDLPFTAPCVDTAAGPCKPSRSAGRLRHEGVEGTPEEDRPAFRSGRSRGGPAARRLPGKFQRPASQGRQQHPKCRPRRHGLGMSPPGRLRGALWDSVPVPSPHGQRGGVRSSLSSSFPSPVGKVCSG